MADHQSNLRRLHELGILVEQEQARQEGVTIPARYLPEFVSADLATALVRLALELQQFSGIVSRKLRIQIVNQAISQVTANVSPSGNVVRIPNAEFWGVVGVNILGAAVYAATHGL